MTGIVHRYSRIWFVNLDPFLRSIAYWITKKYHKALRTLLLEPGSGADDVKYNKLAASGSPDIFNFYVYLRTHPVLRRTQFEKRTKAGTPQLGRKVRKHYIVFSQQCANQVSYQHFMYYIGFWNDTSAERKWSSQVNFTTDRVWTNILLYDGA